MAQMTGIQKIIRRGGVGILPTDTIYGLVGSAVRRKVVERIYRLRKRSPAKPMIVLISSIRDLGKFGIRLDRATAHILHQIWPGKISAVLPCPYGKFAYLHRGTSTIAFRLPAKRSLRSFLRKTGPLAAPSANPEGKPPARTIAEAKEYFGDKVDFYVNAGRLATKPSTLVSILDGKMKVLRQGAVSVRNMIK